MKTIFIICAIFGATLAMPSGKSWNMPVRAPEVRTFQVPAPVHRVEYVSKPVMTEYRVEGPRIIGNLYKTTDTYGQYKFGYSSSDGQSKTEHRLGDGGVSGHFSYLSPEGKTISLAYIADKDGFRPVGDHLPVAPEVPPMPANLAAAYKESNDRLAKAHEEARLRGDSEFSDDGSYREEVKLAVPETKVYQTYVQQVPVVAAPVMYTYPTKSILRSPIAAEPKPQPKPVEYKSISYTAELGAPAPITTYKTYSAAFPTKNIYVSAPEPKKVSYSSSSYSTEIGAAAPLIPAYKMTYETVPQKSIFYSVPKPLEYPTETKVELPAAPTPPAPLTMKSAYAFTGGY